MVRAQIGLLLLVLTAIGCTPAEVPEATEVEKAHDSPQFRCRGNEPFWNLEIHGTEGRYTAMGDEPRELTALWYLDASTDPPTLEWRSVAHGEGAFSLIATVTAVECLDTMSDETPPFSHRVSLKLPERDAVQGCCRKQR